MSKSGQQQDDQPKKQESEMHPPAYTPVSEQNTNYSETQPLLRPQQQPQMMPVMPIMQVPMLPNIATYQVSMASTGQAVPFRILDGYMHLTVVEPVNLFCPSCLQFRTTVIQRQLSCTAYAWSACLCVFLQPFCLVPFCIDNCKETVHCCGCCGTVLAKVIMP